MLLVRCPDTPERRYALDVVLGRFLGLEHRVEPADKGFQVVLEDRELWLEDDFFVSPRLPVSPVPWLRGLELPCGARELPLLFGHDFLGMIFFMLTRWEECVRPERDRFDRLPGRASTAWREGFLTRPVVDQAVELLWRRLKETWPSLERKARHYRLELSHDVDHPYCQSHGVPVRAQVVSLVQDFTKYRQPARALARLLAYPCRQDVCARLDEIMTLSEQHGLRSTFYWIAGHTAGRTDGYYDLDSACIRPWLERIHRRGHCLGLHPSFHTYRDLDALRREADHLRRTAEKLGIVQSEWGGRQHYLRWEPATWRRYEECGLAFDSTLGFSDSCGFRCGTSHSFPAYDHERRQALRLEERPLVAMEGALLDDRRLSLEAAASELEALGKTCRAYDGVMTLLWHNSSLVSKAERATYREVVRALA